MLSTLENGKKKEHFVYIEDLNKLVSKNQVNDKGKHVNNKKFTCFNCLHSFKAKITLDNHKSSGCDLPIIIIFSMCRTSTDLL